MNVIGRILALVRSGRTFLCSSHVRADGDGLGSALAFSFALKKLGKRSHVVCDLGAIPEYAFLPGADKVGSAPEHLWKKYDAVFTFDCATFGRLERIGPSLPKGAPIVNVDHHISNERFGTINWVDDGYASTTEMVYALVRAAKVKIDKPLATCLYVGLVTDTGNFAFGNTTVRSHAIAADLMNIGVRPVEVSDRLYRQRSLGELKLFARCIESIQLSSDGAVGWVRLTEEMMRECKHFPEETQMYVNVVKSLKSVKVAVLFRQIDSRVKISFRTSEGIDGSGLAATWGGGGHMRAAGCTLQGSMDQVERKVIDKTVEFVKHARKTR